MNRIETIYTLIEAEPGIRQIKLKDDLDMSKKRVSICLAKLVDRGLVKSETYKYNRSENIWYVTDRVAIPQDFDGRKNE